MSDSQNLVGGDGAGGASSSGSAKRTGHVGFGGVKYAFPAQYDGSLEDIKGGRGGGGRGGRGRGRGGRERGGGVGGSSGEVAETQGPGGSEVPAGPVAPAILGESGVVGIGESSGKVDLELQKHLPKGLTLPPGADVWSDYDEFSAPTDASLIEGSPMGDGRRGRGGRDGRGVHPGGYQGDQQDVTMADALAELGAQLDEYRNSGPQVEEAEEHMELDYKGGDEPNVII
ncbi:hypothetical protein F4776DRAFT_674353 [Hypoxylon sp. NC0597]|nr:hypothetical protein F4776DRAFT_674353 [Hypoxylon sp. NC0597]